MTPKQQSFIVFLLVTSISIAAYLVAISYMEDQIYMDETDPNNPGSYGGLYITYKVKYIGDTIVDSKDTPHEKTLKYMKWTSENIEFKSPPSRIPHPDVIIDSKVGLCGDYAIVVSSFLATQDIPSRILGMYNKTNGAHVVIEVYYNDSWHMYDPTWEAYWETDHILSFDELRDGGARIATLYYTPRAISPSYYLSPEIYELSDPKGVIGPTHPMWWNLTIDRSYNVSDYTYKHGSDHVGATYLNNNHRWSIVNLTPGNKYSFVVYPKTIYGSDVFYLYINNYTYKVTNKEVYYNFTAINTTERVDLYHNYTENTVLLIERYEILEM